MASTSAKKADVATDTDTPEKPDGSTAFSGADLRGITTMEQALALCTTAYGSVVGAAEEIGDGFSRVDKSKLVDETFLIVEMGYGDGDYRSADGSARSYVWVRVVTEGGRKGWFTDGSTGVYQQLDEWMTKSARTGGLLVEGGLRRSDYEFEDANGVMQPATTYYLNI